MRRGRQKRKEKKKVVLDSISFKNLGIILRTRDSDITQATEYIYGWLCDPSLQFSSLSFSSLQKPLHKFEVNKLLIVSAWPIKYSLRLASWISKVSYLEEFESAQLPTFLRRLFQWPNVLIVANFLPVSNQSPQE